MSHIDVRADLSELTDLVEAVPDNPFMLHPGEFVLGSTSERVVVPDELSRMKHERIVGNSFDQVCQLRQVSTHVDVAHGVVPENQESVVKMEVYRRGLDALLVERLDHDATGGNGFAD